jgi:hypothetical protein
MAMVQGVRQAPPSDDRASALAGFDWISSTVVVGFGFNESKPGMELQPSPRIHLRFGWAPSDSTGLRADGLRTRPGGLSEEPAWSAPARGQRPGSGEPIDRQHGFPALQADLGHRNIQHTVRHTELAPDRFKDFWR